MSIIEHYAAGVANDMRAPRDLDWACRAGLVSAWKPEGLNVTRDGFLMMLAQRVKMMEGFLFDPEHPLNGEPMVCFDNVEAAILEAGGEAVPGYLCAALTGHTGLDFMAHVLWREPNGFLREVTPHTVPTTPGICPIFIPSSMALPRSGQCIRLFRSASERKYFVEYQNLSDITGLPMLHKLLDLADFVPTQPSSQAPKFKARKKQSR
jgi:hypothetical protein